MINTQEPLDKPLLKQFSNWLSVNYDPNWSLTMLVSRAVGIHNGRLHRSLSQIQVKLFEEENGLEQIISTSSIIKGVNTSAKNVVLWSNKNGSLRLNDFTYRNIIGRGGRMFHHFIGKIFILEEPPEQGATSLQIEMPNELLGTYDEESSDFDLTQKQIAKIIAYKEEMQNLVGEENFLFFQKKDIFQSSDSSVILNIAKDIHLNSTS